MMFRTALMALVDGIREIIMQIRVRFFNKKMAKYIIPRFLVWELCISATLCMYIKDRAQDGHCSVNFTRVLKNTWVIGTMIIQAVFYGTRRSVTEIISVVIIVIGVVLFSAYDLSTDKIGIAMGLAILALETVRGIWWEEVKKYPLQQLQLSYEVGIPTFLTDVVACVVMSGSIRDHDFGQPGEITALVVFLIFSLLEVLTLDLITVNLTMTQRYAVEAVDTAIGFITGFVTQRGSDEHIMIKSLACAIVLLGSMALSQTKSTPSQGRTRRHSAGHSSGASSDKPRPALSTAS
jgi:hypothetical protein